MYADIEANTTVIYEEIAFEIQLRSGKLTLEGALDGLISLKLAQTDKVKATIYELEQLIKSNIEVLNIEQLGELVLSYGIEEANHLK